MIEIVSSNATDDYSRKLDLYKRSGVREYWIIDPGSERVVVYIFSPQYELNIYTFDMPIPVGIYGGEVSIRVDEMI